MDSHLSVCVQHPAAFGRRFTSREAKPSEKSVFASGGSRIEPPQ